MLTEIGALFGYATINAGAVQGCIIGTAADTSVHLQDGGVSEAEAGGR